MKNLASTPLPDYKIGKRKEAAKVLQNQNPGLRFSLTLLLTGRYRLSFFSITFVKIASTPTH